MAWWTARTCKTIPIARVEVGMFIVGLDRSWLRTPFFRHSWLVEREEDLATLKAAGVRFVTIDPAKGKDVAAPSAVHPQPPEPSGGQSVAGSAPVASPDGQAKGSNPVAQLAKEMHEATAVRTEALAAVERVFAGIKTGVPLDAPALRLAVQQTYEGLMRYPTALLAVTQLQQMKRLNKDLFAHAVDVCTLSLILGQADGLSESLLMDLGMGALLHDVGQTRLPQNVMQKQGTWSEYERRIVRLHPHLGLTMLSSAPTVSDDVRAIVYQHHERLDGSGYPDGLSGTRLSLLGQIVGIVDTYDAMAVRRDNRPALPPCQGIRRLYRLGQQALFDRLLVEQLIHVLGVYPVGSLVELTTDEQAVVVAVNQEARLAPIVKLLTDAQGRPIDDPPTVDLAEPARGGPARAIVRAVEGMDGVSHLHDSISITKKHLAATEYCP